MNKHLAHRQLYSFFSPEVICSRIIDSLTKLLILHFSLIWTELAHCNHKLNVVQNFFTFAFITFSPGQHADVVGSTVISQLEGSGWSPALVLSVWNLHVLPMHALVFSGQSGFFSQPRNKEHRLTSDSKLSQRSKHECVCLWGPSINWWAVHGVPCLHPEEERTGSDDPCDPELD